MDKALFSNKKRLSSDLKLDDGGVKPSGKKRQNEKLVALIKYACYFAVMILLIVARTGGVYPFSLGLYLALVYLGQNAFVLAPLFIIACLIATSDFAFLISVVLCAFIVCATAFIFSKTRKKLPFWLVLTLGFIAQSSALYFVVIGSVSALRFVLEAVLSPLFTYACVCALGPLLLKSVRYRIMPTTVACFSAFASAVACGASLITIFDVKVYYVLLILCIGLGVTAFGKRSCVLCALAFSLGNALAFYQTQSVAFACFISAVFALFSDAPRPVSVTATLIGATGFALYFDFDYLNLLAYLISLSLGGIIYCLIPKNALKWLSEFFAKKDGRAIKSLINGARTEACDELIKTGAVFATMSKTLRQSSFAVSAKEDELVSKLSRVCGDCSGCDRSALRSLISVTIEKGRATVNDVADFIRCDCPRTAQLISVADEEVNAVKKRAKATLENDKRREETAKEFEMVGAILRERALTLGAPFVSDPIKEDSLLDELAYAGVPAVEAISTSATMQRITVALATEPDDGGRKVAEIAGKVYRSAYAVESVTDAKIDDYNLVCLREKTPYDVLFATSSVSKNAEATGDTHSFIRISDSKFMMALCDGMGSGVGASKISERAIELVECFFRAGFDSKFVLECVNKFLVSTDEENFVAFDILVCDLNTLERTIIKMGSPTSFIRKSDAVMKLDGNALPLGALGELKPFVSQGKSEENETVLFLSDGVTDALSEKRIAEIVATNSLNSLRGLCDEIIAQAKTVDPAVSDDMTAIASRIIRRI